MDRECSCPQDMERNWRRLGLRTGEGEDWGDEVMMIVEVVDGEGKGKRKVVAQGKTVTTVTVPTPIT